MTTRKLEKTDSALGKLGATLKAEYWMSDMSQLEREAAVELENSAIHLLHRASQCAGDVYQTQLPGEDLTPRQFAILVAVSQNEGLSQTQLVEKTGIDRSTLADIVRRMLKKGLLQRRRTKDDARAYAVKLTDEGVRVLRRAEPLVQKVDERLLNLLPTERRANFIKDLHAIIANLNAAQQ